MTLRVGITETEFLAQVLQLAKLRGWRTLHIRPGRTARGWRTPVQGDGVGFPDLLLIRGAVLIVAELKVGKNQTTPEQKEWLRAFLPFAKVRVWTPADWEQIERELM